MQNCLYTRSVKCEVRRRRRREGKQEEAGEVFSRTGAGQGWVACGVAPGFSTLYTLPCTLLHLSVPIDLNTLSSAKLNTALLYITSGNTGHTWHTNVQSRLLQYSCVVHNALLLYMFRSWPSLPLTISSIQEFIIEAFLKYMLLKFRHCSKVEWVEASLHLPTWAEVGRPPACLSRVLLLVWPERHYYQEDFPNRSNQLRTAAFFWEFKPIPKNWGTFVFALIWVSKIGCGHTYFLADDFPNLVTRLGIYFVRVAILEKN